MWMSRNAINETNLNLHYTDHIQGENNNVSRFSPVSVFSALIVIVNEIPIGTELLSRISAIVSPLGLATIYKWPKLYLRNLVSIQ